MMIVAQNDEIAGVASAGRMHRIRVMSFDECVPTFCKFNVAAYWREFVWRFRGKADLAMVRVLLLFQFLFVEQLYFWRRSLGRDLGTRGSARVATNAGGR